MGRHDQTVTRTVSLLASIAALVIAIAPPLTSLLAAQDRVNGALETSARLHAAEVALVARQTPGFWQLEALRVATLDASEFNTVPERRRVYNRDGHLVVETPAATELAWPVRSKRVPIMDGGQQLGEAEASRSFRSALVRSSWVGVASALGALLIFVVLRIVPLRLLHHALDRATYLSAHDVLTGLPNRALFHDRLKQALAQGQRLGRSPALLCIDLDHFKQVNDTLGHAAGDQLLCALSERIGGCLREGDTLARLGGDEFAVIQPYATGAQDAETVAHRILHVARAPVDLNGQQAQVSLSIGIALGDVGTDSAHLLQNADIALYQAKDNGRAQWCFFDPKMNARLQERRALEQDLRGALARQELFLLYQPQVDLKSGKVVGAEALLRWRRSADKIEPPDRFIALSEEIGLIGTIGAWVIQEACRTGATWPDHIGIAVNVSPAQFRRPGFEAAVLEALQASGISPSRLELEITEGLLLNDTSETLRILNRLRAIGVRIAMDDFGTGYSSLAYVQKFHFDRIKIDRHFVMRMTSDRSAAAIVKAVIAMARAMGVTTIAEGVETTDQARSLILEGCNEAQGFLYGRPMTIEAFLQTLVPDEHVG
jgi:diguanylate cyclase (GGDEF)-like protein